MAAFPTLLTSRPRLLEGDKAPSPVVCAEPVLGPICPEPVTRLPEAYPDTVRVRNTFIDTAEQRSPSLEDFYREREVLTCPSSKVGRLRNLFRESGTGDQESSSPRVPKGLPPYEKLPNPIGHRGARPRAAPPAPPAAANGRRGGGGGGGGQSRVLKLAEALGSPAALAEQPPVEPLVAVGGGGQACTWGTRPSMTLAHDVPCLPDANAGSYAGAQCFAQPDMPGAAALGGFYAAEAAGPPGGFGGMSGLEVLLGPPAQRPGCALIDVPADSLPPLPVPYPQAGPPAPPAPGARMPPAPGMAGPVGGPLASPVLEPPAVPAPPTGPAPGSPELPSIGSAEHASGQCKPCAFVHTVGCTSALTCQFCHLCEPGERKRRRREKLEVRRAERKSRAAAGPAAAGAGA